MMPRALASARLSGWSRISWRMCAACEVS